MLTLMGKHLMGQAEIADRLGVSRQRVQQRIAKGGFPPPFDVLAMGKVWWIKDIDEWIHDKRPELADSEPGVEEGPIGKRHGRTGPRKPAAPAKDA